MHTDVPRGLARVDGLAQRAVDNAEAVQAETQMVGLDGHVHLAPPPPQFPTVGNAQRDTRVGVFPSGPGLASCTAAAGDGTGRAWRGVARQVRRGHARGGGRGLASSRCRCSVSNFAWSSRLRSVLCMRARNRTSSRLRPFLEDSTTTSTASSDQAYLLLSAADPQVTHMMKHSVGEKIRLGSCIADGQLPRRHSCKNS